jgi:3-methyladenine DNA glycosylase AlkD
MITTGAWWDYVDEVAARRVGPLLAARPEVIRPAILRWCCDGNLWRRRSSIICQLSFKAATDLDLLYACIDANLDDQDFFIRKAIGWALRQYARTDPAAAGIARHRTRFDLLAGSRDTREHARGDHPSSRLGRGCHGIGRARSGGSPTDRAD